MKTRPTQVLSKMLVAIFAIALTACAPQKNDEVDRSTDPSASQFTGYRILWQCAGRSFPDSSEVLVFSLQQSETDTEKKLFYAERKNIRSDANGISISATGLILTPPKTLDHDPERDIVTVNVSTDRSARQEAVTYDNANRTLFFDLSFGMGVIDCANMTLRQ